MVEYLKETNGRADLRELVEYIAGKEGKNDSRHRKSVYVSLVQTHIPTLRREGVITFDHGVVTLLKVPENVTVYMETVGRHDISWSSFYIGTSVVFILAGWYFGSMHLLLAAFVYLAMGLIHHWKVRRLF